MFLLTHAATVLRLYSFNPLSKMITTMFQKTSKINHISGMIDDQKHPTVRFGRPKSTEIFGFK